MPAERHPSEPSYLGRKTLKAKENLGLTGCGWRRHGSFGMPRRAEGHAESVQSNGTAGSGRLDTRSIRHARSVVALAEVLHESFQRIDRSGLAGGLAEARRLRVETLR